MPRFQEIQKESMGVVELRPPLTAGCDGDGSCELVWKVFFALHGRNAKPEFAS